MRSDAVKSRGVHARPYGHGVVTRPLRQSDAPLPAEPPARAAGTDPSPRRRHAPPPMTCTPPSLLRRTACIRPRAITGGRARHRCRCAPGADRRRRRHAAAQRRRHGGGSGRCGGPQRVGRRRLSDALARGQWQQVTAASTRSAPAGVVATWARTRAPWVPDGTTTRAPSGSRAWPPQPARTRSAVGCGLQAKLPNTRIKWHHRTWRRRSPSLGARAEDRVLLAPSPLPPAPPPSAQRPCLPGGHPADVAAERPPLP